MPDRLHLAALVRGVTVLSMGGLVFVVLGAATIAVLAEFTRTWRWYFLMERAMALATPVAVTLLGVSLAGMLGVVALAGRE
ncbi:MAG: hypothetical protein ABEI80_07480 [Haloplanus sp.]